MLIVFYILAALLIFLSFKSFRGGIEFRRYVRGELAKPASSFTPFASIMVPCKGLDDGLEENLSALLEQNYPGYEVIFVVDDENDPAVAIIKKVSLKAANLKTKLIVASKAIESGQKVENLRDAVLQVADESRVFVFVDSDARPDKDWLAPLITPLENDDIGAATGYRWFIAKRPSFASELRSAWNASIASALGPNLGSNFCWGGSMAIRRDVFERLDIREQWRGTLSDDFTVTRVIKATGLSIYFVPQALTASVDNCTFREMLEFTTRQMKITRVYSPSLWKLSFFGSGLFNLVLLLSFLNIGLTSPTNASFWIAAATIILVFFFSIGKSWLRFNAVREIFADRGYDLSGQVLLQNTLWLLCPAIFLYNSIAAGLSRQMTWRGIRYDMVSPTETRILSPTQDQL